MLGEARAKEQVVEFLDGTGTKHFTSLEQIDASIVELEKTVDQTRNYLKQRLENNESVSIGQIEAFARTSAELDDLKRLKQGKPWSTLTLE